MPARFLLALLLLAGPALAAEAATVHLRDGRRLTGIIVSATARDLQLFTGGATTRIDAADILRVDYDDASPPPTAAPAAATAPTTSLYRQTWNEERRHQLGMDIALTIPVGDVNFASIGGGSGANGDVSGAFGGHYLYFPRRSLGLGFGVDYLSRGPTNSPGLLPLADSSTGGGSVALMALAKLILKPGEPVQPYLLAGFGAARTWTTIDAQPRPGFVWDDTSTDEPRRLVDGQAWGPAGTLRVGLDFWADSPSVFSLEAGWTGIASASYGATAQGRAIGLSGVSGSLHIVTIGGRWAWRF